MKFMAKIPQIKFFQEYFSGILGSEYSIEEKSDIQKKRENLPQPKACPFSVHWFN